MVFCKCTKESCCKNVCDKVMLEEDFKNILYDCLENIKIANKEMYKESIVVFYELYTRMFNTEDFIKWCKLNSDKIKARDETILSPQNYIVLANNVLKNLHRAPKDDLWEFLVSVSKCCCV